MSSYPPSTYREWSNKCTDQDLQWGCFLCLYMDLNVWVTAPSTRKTFYPSYLLSNRARPMARWRTKGNMRRRCRFGHLVRTGLVGGPNLGVSLYSWWCKIWNTACGVLGSYYLEMNSISLDSCCWFRYLCIQCPLMWVSGCYDEDIGAIQDHRSSRARHQDV